MLKIVAHFSSLESGDGLMQKAVVRGLAWIVAVVIAFPQVGQSQVNFTHVVPDPVYDFNSNPPLTINRTALPVFFSGTPHYTKLGFDVKTNLAGSDYRDVLVATIVDKVTPANFVYQDIFGIRWYRPAGAIMASAFRDELILPDPVTGISECPPGQIYITELTLQSVTATDSGGVKATYGFSLQCRVPNPAYANLPPASRPDDFLYLFAANCKVSISYEQAHSIPGNGPGSSPVATATYFKLTSSGGVSFYLPSGDGSYASRVYGADTTFAIDSWESDSGNPSAGMARTIQWINRCFNGTSYTRDQAFESVFPGGGFASFLGDAVFQPFLAFGLTVPKEQVQGGAGGLVASHIASMNQQAIDSGDSSYFVILNLWAVNYPKPPDLGSAVSDIQLESQGSIVLNGAVHNFAARSLGTTSSATFIVKNVGNSDLNPLHARVIGVNPGDFSIATAPTAPVAPGGQTGMSVSFSPTAAGTRSATLVIDSNDPDESPFRLQLAGTGTSVEAQPEIVVETPTGTGISTGGTFSFGNVTVGSPATQVLTIRNTGTSMLTGVTASLDGTDSAHFSLSVPPATQVPAGSISTVSIRCQPTSAGMKSARLRIVSNDGDENPFDVLLNANASQPTLSLRLTGPNGQTVSNGGSGPVGVVPLGSTSEVVFGVANTGTTQISALTAAISVGGGDFSLLAAPTPALSPGAGTECQIRFNPQAIGFRHGVLEIRSGGMLLASVNLEGGGTVPSSPAVFRGPEINSANGHFYYLLEGSTWTAAEAKARAMNGHLTTINDSAEQSWVMANFNATDSLWLGLSDATTEGAFRWADGDLAPYRNWFPGEPNGSSAEEDYTIVWAASYGSGFAGLWNDIADVNPFGARGVVELAAPPPDITVSTSQYWDIYSGLEIELPATPIGVPTNLEVVLSNQQSTAVSAIKPFIDGEHAQDFAIVGLAPSSVAGGEEAPLSVRFLPSQLGRRSAQLTLVSNDPDESPFRIQLLGYGVDPVALYQVWATDSGLSGTNGDPNSIPFSDGVPNLLKYAFNLAGDGPDTSVVAPYFGLSGLPRVTFIHDPDESTCIIEYVRRKRSGLNYVAKKSPNLAPGSFVPLTADPFVVSEYGEWEHVMVHDNFHLSTTPRAYYRVEVSIP